MDFGFMFMSQVKNMFTLHEPFFPAPIRLQVCPFKLSSEKNCILMVEANKKQLIYA